MSFWSLSSVIFFSNTDDKNLHACMLKSFSTCKPAESPSMTLRLCSLYQTPPICELQAIHLCKEASWQVQQNHLCRKSQMAGWALSPSRRAAERWPWAATGCWSRSEACSHRGHKNPGCSSSPAGCKYRGGLDHSRWSYTRDGQGRGGKKKTVIVNDKPADADVQLF